MINPEDSTVTAHKVSGFSLIELLIAIAIIGIVAAVGIPAYRSYIDTANMSRTNAAYENAIRVIRDEFAKVQTRATLGLVAQLPQSDNDWVKVLDPSGSIMAPAGGPIYIAGRPSRNGTSTGAIYIRMNRLQTRVNVFRPPYLELEGYRTIISNDTVETRKWNFNDPDE